MKKELENVTTRDYTERMNPIVSSRLSSGEPFKSASLNDISIAPEMDGIVSVRTAKAQLSSLLDLVEQGREVIITSNGRPKARLVAVGAIAKSKPFAFSPGYTPPPWRGGPTADEIIREDRDSRGW